MSLAFVAGCQKQHAERPLQATAQATCIEGPWLEDPPGKKWKPTAKCSYSFDELFSRIEQLLDDDGHAYDAKDAEHLLSIPSLTAQTSEPDYSFYSMRITGREGWQVELFVDVESTFNEINFRVSAPPATVTEPREHCVRYSRLFELASQEVWQEQEPQPPPPHGGSSGIVFRKGQKQIALQSSREDCIRDDNLSFKWIKVAAAHKTR